MFIKIKEHTELLNVDRFIPIETDLFVNVDQINFIREAKEKLMVHLTNGKVITVKDVDNINYIMKELKLGKRSLNENG